MTPRWLAALLVPALLGGCGLLDEAADEPEPAGGGTWQEQAAAIDGIADYRTDRPEMLTRDHTEGSVSYDVLPPVGGDHNPIWLDCEGTVYEQPVPNENAVHSLEHGAVWITYRPDLPADEVAALAERVAADTKMFMSPFPELDAPISLQAWGYQLKVDDAGDDRIDEFIRVLRVNASPEGPNARCDGALPG
jgi:uncharacterized protein DUF3105